MLKNNPVMKKLVETGEERIGKLAQQLLSNEKFVTAIQTAVSRTLAAKGTLDKSLRSALSAMNLPSTADMEILRNKVDDLERLLAGIETKVDQLAGPPGKPEKKKKEG
jgi:polyhydroxyalkanoate synthesis regulator phasin